MKRICNKEEVMLAANLYAAQPATPGPTIDKGFVPSSLANSQLCLHFIAPTSKKVFALLKQSLHKCCFFLGRMGGLSIELFIETSVALSLEYNEIRRNFQIINHSSKRPKRTI